MKNKLLILILSLCFLLINSSYSEELNFESSQIEILEKGNLIKAAQAATLTRQLNWTLKLKAAT